MYKFLYRLDEHTLIYVHQVTDLIRILLSKKQCKLFMTSFRQAWFAISA